VTAGLSCQQLVELVTAYVEGVLPDTDRARFEEHVDSCHGCVVYVDQIRATIRLTGETRHEETLPPDAREALIAHFRDARRA
jgi:anti-sigma factor RsiW